MTPYGVNAVKMTTGIEACYIHGNMTATKPSLIVPKRVTSVQKYSRKSLSVSYDANRGPFEWQICFSSTVLRIERYYTVHITPVANTSQRFECTSVVLSAQSDQD